MTKMSYYVLGVVDKMVNNNFKDRILFLDILRVIAIIAVLTIHTSAPIVKKYNLITLDDWLIGNFYDSISRWSVPILVMISGSLLLGHNERTDVFLKKRFNKVLLPFFFWSIVYIFWKQKENIYNIYFYSIIADFLNSPFYHLWFVYMILGIYLMTPILRIYVQNADINNIKYFIIIWLIMTILIALGLKINLYYSFTGYVGYFILGYYLMNFKLRKKYRILVYILSFLGTIITIIGTYYATLNDNALNQLYYDSLSLNVIFMSTGIFILFQNINWKKYINDRIVNMIIELSSLSYGIYLVHALILDFLDEKFKIVTLFNPVVGIPLITLITLVTSFLIIKTMKKFPISKNLC